MTNMMLALLHNVQKSIIGSFTQPHGCTRLLIATVAFAMGLDAPSVHEVIHWGPPDDIEMYVQETGRAGHDGLPAHAILYYDNREVSEAITSHASVHMKAYCKNQTLCRRKLLMSSFVDSNTNIQLPVYMHACCDLCALKCSCRDCSLALSVTEDISLDDTASMVLIQELQAQLTESSLQLCECEAFAESRSMVSCIHNRCCLKKV